jgi:hypothetical protein
VRDPTDVDFEIVGSETVGTERESLLRLTIDRDITQAGCWPRLAACDPTRTLQEDER